MSPAEFSIKNRLISFLVIIGVLVGGWLAYGNMPRFEDPEFTIREAVVITQYPGATPEEVANEVTEPLESAIQQMGEVEEVRSVSSDGLSRITVEIKYGDSTTRDALQLIWTKLRNRVRDAQSSLPPGAEESIVNDDFGDVYGIYYLITGEGYSPRELYEYARDLRTELLAVDGVAKVAIQGQQQEVIYVEISRERASALGVSVDQVYNDLAQQNSVVSSGDVRIGDRRVMIQPTGEVDSVASIENILVSTPEADTVVFLRDVATVRRDYQDPPSFQNRYNGEPSIGIGVSNVPGTNVVAMGEAIDAALAESEGRRPLGIEIHEYYHQGKVTDAAVQAFALNVLMALVIVLVTLYFFMGLRSAIIIGAVLILTIAATLMTMYLNGIPMHRISLGALIIALGMLVDNAIVVTEGILVGVQKGRKKLDIAKEIVSRSKWPLLGGTLVGIIAFAPIGFAPGSTAEFTGHLFWVVLISLLYSWVFAITAVPLFADMLFKEVEGDAVEEQGDGKFMTRYKDFMRAVLGRPWQAVGAAVMMFVVAVFGFGFVKSGFFPASTTPQLVVDVWMPQGTDIEHTFDNMTQLESEVAEFEGVEGVNTLIGAGALRFMLVYPAESNNSSYGQLLLQVDYDQIDALMPVIQNHIDSNYPDAQTKVWRFELGPGGGSKLEAEFSGPDPAVLRQLSAQAEVIYASDDRITAVKNDWRQRVSVIEPTYSEARSRRLGISREDLANALRTNFSGRNVGVYREGDTLIPIVARAPLGERRDVQSIASVQIPSQVTGGTVPLIETVTGFETVWRDAMMRRIDRVWTIKAQADPIPGEMASVAFERVRPAIEAIELPPGYTLTWRGEYGSSTEANGNLASTLPMGFLAMVLVVVVLFNALRQPLIIWLVVPLSIIGVVIGLLLTNSALEFMAILGLLSLSGLLIKNAIVLVDQMDLEIREGKPRYDAVIDSAASRVRPVAMGAITTVLGVIPLFADAFFRSMAVVLVFGLSFATLLTLVLIPVLYLLFFRISRDETADAEVEA
ncbi:efflux RND transporter permease subunit [Parasphingopyxis sp. CP4]|uniref:efflux RND transporter permease subunit n=1 Tax=Parasphingopyxis sp. CP4 TaxID=2724527 RepID=UPI0015A211B2|nr:efflux RND transporter permease subunit [Parasphingopyxis sp. CP4]QLC22019.1 efflux RND transporter permease subunit [Parasphingopyxis sp. CP4]